MGDSPEDRWASRAKTITLLWQALRAPLCWTLAAVLIVYEAIGARHGHSPDPSLIVLIGGLFGMPFFFVGRGNGDGS